MSQVDDTRLIPLTQGKFAIVDAADYEWLNQWKWYAARAGQSATRWYAVHSFLNDDGEYRTKGMHRLIMGDSSETIDHRDNDGLNNSRSNLRFATSSQNSANKDMKVGRSGYRGVYLEESGKYRARLWYRGDSIGLGMFDTAEEAARAWDNGMRQHHGEFARLNFPE